MNGVFDAHGFISVKLIHAIHVQMNHNEDCEVTNKSLHEQMQINERDNSNKNKVLNQRKRDALRSPKRSWHFMLFCLLIYVWEVGLFCPVVFAQSCVCPAELLGKHTVLLSCYEFLPRGVKSPWELLGKHWANIGRSFPFEAETQQKP